MDIHGRYGARIVQRHQLDGSHSLVGEFVAHFRCTLEFGARYSASVCEAFFALSCLGYQPVAKRLHAGPLQGPWWIDHVIGEASREAEFERPHQSPCAKIVGHQGTTAEHDALAPDRSLDRVIGREKRRTQMRVDNVDPGVAQPYGPVDGEYVVQECVVS
jgi:hypothetical protein